MSEHMFGLVRKGSPKHNGMVRSAARRVEAVAQQHDADFVCASPPGSDLLGWFTCPNRGSPFDDATAREVTAAVEAAGLGWIWDKED